MRERGREGDVSAQRSSVRHPGQAHSRTVVNSEYHTGAPVCGASACQTTAAASSRL